LLILKNKRVLSILLTIKNSIWKFTQIENLYLQLELYITISDSSEQLEPVQGREGASGEHQLADRQGGAAQGRAGSREERWSCQHALQDDRRSGDQAALEARLEEEGGQVSLERIGIEDRAGVELVQHQEPGLRDERQRRSSRV